MTDDPSVLGNLPRSRPGRRSSKRASAGAPKSQASAKPAGAAPKRKPAASRAQGAAKPRPRAGARPGSGRTAQVPPQTPDPLTGAIRLAGQVAGAGMKVAGEVLKRLPGR